MSLCRGGGGGGDRRVDTGETPRGAAPQRDLLNIGVSPLPPTPHPTREGRKGGGIISANISEASNIHATYFFAEVTFLKRKKKPW